jgi:CrcB protein
MQRGNEVLPRETETALTADDFCDKRISGRRFMFWRGRDFVMMECLYVGLGGFIGTVCRYLISLIPLKTESGFPILTFLINVAGAFAVSLIAGFTTKEFALSQNAVLFLKVGVCGGFTTFSAFSLETMTLMRNGSYIVAASYALLSVVFGVLAAFGAQLLIAD